jgi:hypothetical protein
MLSVSHERNNNFHNNPPILLQAHTLNNASRMASSRRFLNDEATGDEQSPLTTPERVRILPPQVFTSEATGLTPSAADQSLRREDNFLSGGNPGGSSNLLKQRSINALNTNLPRVMPNANLPPKLSTSGSATKLINIAT